ncbi:hypothetical protein MYAM1_002104 [Malassezia yamatoensis]|uniref:Queuosine 5'-phosphate N-glycosylase/hydrolase n=1 Tax=Malassezia yamatoensis TaxID=253288 RepID=A0AAJ5YSH5_9BASI|nr:hypothetical protein MYAM1_002104 [Malassezia yamatoensis]
MQNRVEEVRASCVFAKDQSNIAISDDRIRDFFAKLDTDRFQKLKNEHGLIFPLKFPSFSEEINFICVLSLLNACSGYRQTFHKVTGHGAADNIRRLLLGMYLSDEKALSAENLTKVTATQLATVLGVDTHTESQHPTLPFVTMGNIGGPLHEPLQLIATACQAAGQFLEKNGQKSLGLYVLDACSEAQHAADFESHLLDLIVRVPGFDDECTLEGRPVYIYKKAFYLLNALREQVIGRLAPNAPPIAHQLAEKWRDGFPQPIPMFVDNVIPTLLRHFGVLDLESCSSEALRDWTVNDNEVPLHQDDAYRIRAASLVAGGRMAELSPFPMTEVELDAYLWSIAKDPELRPIPRISEKNTIAY